MRAPDGFHIEWVDDEAVVFDPATGTLHYLNPQAAYVYALILEVGVEGARGKVETSFGPAAASGDFTALVDDMQAKGLLVDD
jgi:hypothetical protein